ncbi:hypothetical protein B0T10DRAFT_611120 [Thelonectria olida]|uniref:Uncharacterized protein n=1 Tax=Thelonectria olida TaxID=1576542 RepID=A0A9P9AHS5_9HYPO|nr:hypothetical protein B0T10DRAFT_611120 [Thelonectria olida]
MEQHVLAENSIFLRAEPALIEASPLPPLHVLRLRNTLLNFDRTIPHEFQLSTEKELQYVSFFSMLRAVPEDERTRITSSLAHCDSLKECARRLCLGPHRETDWAEFYHREFLSPFSAKNKLASRGSGSHKTRPPIKPGSDYFQHGKLRSWGLFEPSHGFRTDDRIGLSAPCPDWTASYTILNSAPTEEILAPSRHEVNNIDGNFSRTTLERLAQHGLDPDASGLIRRKGKGFGVSRCICFPWLVVEHMRVSDDELSCWKRGANAGAAAVMLFQNLATYAQTESEGQHIPPVVTVTTERRLVRVWITYSCKGSTGYKMDCIWKGNMAMAFDIIKFEAILENAHMWAECELRPLISRCIDQWKFQFPTGPGPASQAPVESKNPPLMLSDGVKLVASSTTPVCVGDPTVINDLGTALQEVLRESLESTNPDPPPRPSTRSIGMQTGHDEPVVSRPVPSMSRQPRDIFKKRILVKNARGRRIPVKLPDVSSAELAASKPGLVPKFQPPVRPRRVIATPTSEKTSKPLSAELPILTRTTSPKSQSEPKVMATPSPKPFTFSSSAFTSTSFNVGPPAPKSEVPKWNFSDPGSGVEQPTVDWACCFNPIRGPTPVTKDDQPTPALESSQDDYDADDDEWEDTDETAT